MPKVPASTTLIGSKVPLLTRKPENGIMISLGIGISALSKIINKNIPGYPRLDINDMTKSITGFRISNVIDNEFLEKGWHKYLFIFEQWHFDVNKYVPEAGLEPAAFRL